MKRSLLLDRIFVSGIKRTRNYSKRRAENHSDTVLAQAWSHVILFLDYFLWISTGYIVVFQAIFSTLHVMTSEGTYRLLLYRQFIILAD
jgi:hypothetical protein